MNEEVKHFSWLVSHLNTCRSLIFGLKTSCFILTANLLSSLPKLYLEFAEEKIKYILIVGYE